MNIKPKYTIHDTKVVNVVQSCDTMEQLASAKRYVNFLKIFGKKTLQDYEETCLYLDELIEVKERQLKYL